jgi:hypothetical protein
MASISKESRLPMPKYYSPTPKSHHLYKIIMRSGIAEVLTNFGDETTKPIVMYAGRILREAIQKNDIEYAKEVVNKVTSKDIRYAMFTAVGLGHLKMVKLLMRYPCDEYDYSRLLRNAYWSRNVKMQNYILQFAKDGCYNVDELAFKRSFGHGILMSNIHEFKIYNRNEPHDFLVYNDAIWSADKNIIMSALNFLYSEPLHGVAIIDDTKNRMDVSKISYDDKSHILEKACCDNNIEIIKYVMNECKIGPSYFSTIFQKIIVDINNETLNFILNYHDFNDMYRFDLCIDVILRNSDLEMAKSLMRQIDITPFSEYVNREEIFNEIKDRLKEPERSNTEFRIACKLGRYDDVKRLIDKVDPENVGYSFTPACISGCIKTVKLMFWRIYNHDNNRSYIFELLGAENEEMVRFAIEQVRNQMLYFRHRRSER